MESIGLVALMGSGETSAAGGQVFDAIAARLNSPLKISVLETPAGFELNSDRVAGRVAEFIQTRLQNYRPDIQVIAARRRGTPFSPDSAGILAAMLDSNMIFMGPGSPTYAIRQLQGSLAWDMIQVLHRLGAAFVLASAATISIGCCALPVYEIYKVGEDPHWKPGLDFFGAYGLSLAFIPHWNNSDGGSDVDTSHCFIGAERFASLRTQLTQDTMVVGLDEHTGLIMDLNAQVCQVIGKGQVHLVKSDWEKAFSEGSQFSLHELGSFHSLHQIEDRISPVTCREVSAQRSQRLRERALGNQAPPEVLELVELRQRARLQKNWAESDLLRKKIAEMGWKLQDTSEGPRLERA